MVPHQQTLETAERLKAANVKHELIVLPGIDQSFIGMIPEQAVLRRLIADFCPQYGSMRENQSPSDNESLI